MPLHSHESFAKIVEHHGKLILGVVVSLAIFSILGASRLMVENSFINYFKENTEIYKGMKKIDNNLGGTTPLEIVVKFPKAKADVAVIHPLRLSMVLKMNLMRYNDAKYWFTAQKMETILKVHDYLLSLPEVGNVSSNTL